MERNNYFERKAVSRSLLSELVLVIHNELKQCLTVLLVRVESDAMIFGSAV